MRKAMAMAMAVVTAALAACGGGVATAGSGRPIEGNAPPAAATGLRVRAVAARGVLAYDVAAAGNVVATIELGERFELVIRGAASRRPETAATPLGDASYDFVAVALDAGGDRAAVAGLDGTVRLFAVAAATDAGRPPAPTETARFRLDDSATAVALAPAGDLLATGAASGVLCLRRVADGALLQCVADHGGRVTRLAFSRDGARLASAGWDGRAVVWDVPSLRVRARAAGHGALTALAFSPDGAQVALARATEPPQVTRASTGGIEIWRWRDEAPRAADARGVPSDHDDASPAPAPTALVYTPDGRRLLAAGWDGAVRLLDVASGAELARLRAFPPVLRGLALAPGGASLWVAGWAGADPRAPALTRVELLYPSERAEQP
jgi:WD40 repeat protein